MGFSNMALVIFLPVLISAIAVFSAAMMMIYQRTAVDRICKIEVMRLQHEMSGILEKLLRLNRPARTLRIQRAHAEASLTVALDSANPVAIAAAQAYRSAIITQQATLASKQQALLAEAGLAREIADRKMFSHRGEHGLRGSVPRPDHAPTLAVRPNPPDSLSPDYLLADDFRDLQSQTYDYHFDVLERLPDWLKRIFHQKGELPESMWGNCSASLKNEEKKWKPILNTANP
jgi:hypothetical protein